jgi:hypothetical protein
VSGGSIEFIKTFVVTLSVYVFAPLDVIIREAGYA